MLRFNKRRASDSTEYSGGYDKFFHLFYSLTYC